MEYVPFGEVLLDERRGSFNTPWLFNDRRYKSTAFVEVCDRRSELDEETGWYYYGAKGGALAGGLCGPAAWVCSPVGAIAGGIGGYFAGKAAAETAYDYVVTPGAGIGLKR